jgi:hypothetical protein
MRRPVRLLPFFLLAAAIAGGCGSDESDQSAAPGTTGTETTGAETTGGQQSGTGGGGAPAGVRAHACRDNGDESRLLRVTGVDCATGETIASGWSDDRRCRPAGGQSRSACSVGEFRCLASAVGRGVSVTCARPQRSIAFIVKR